MGSMEGRELWSHTEEEEREREREWGEHRVSHKEETFPQPLTGKTRGVDFCEICNQWGSKTRVRGPKHGQCGAQ